MRDNILINDMKNLGAGREFPPQGKEWEEKRKEWEEKRRKWEEKRRLKEAVVYRKLESLGKTCARAD